MSNRHYLLVSLMSLPVGLHSAPPGAPGSACCTGLPALGAVGLTGLHVDGTVLGPVLGRDFWDSDDMQVISRVVALSHQLVVEPRPENY